MGQTRYGCRGSCCCCCPRSNSVREDYAEWCIFSIDFSTRDLWRCPRSSHLCLDHFPPLVVHHRTLGITSLVHEAPSTVVMIGGMPFTLCRWFRQGHGRELQHKDAEQLRWWSCPNRSCQGQGIVRSVCVRVRACACVCVCDSLHEATDVLRR